MYYDMCDWYYVYMYYYLCWLLYNFAYTRLVGAAVVEVFIGTFVIRISAGAAVVEVAVAVEVADDAICLCSSCRGLLLPVQYGVQLL